MMEAYIVCPCRSALHYIHLIKTILFMFMHSKAYFISIDWLFRILHLQYNVLKKISFGSFWHGTLMWFWKDCVCTGIWKLVTFVFSLFWDSQSGALRVYPDMVRTCLYVAPIFSLWSSSCHLSVWLWSVYQNIFI